MLLRTKLATAFFSLITYQASALDMSGVVIGGLANHLPSIEGKITAQNRMGPFGVRLYKLSDGNDLSITFTSKSNRIVYSETDWGGVASGSYADFGGFVFGKTTLAEIRQKLGSNGFSYSQHMFFKDNEGNLIFFNSFETKKKPSIVVTFGTKISASRSQDFITKNVKSGDAVLDAVIYAEPDYVNTIWGSINATDPLYHPIE